MAMKLLSWGANSHGQLGQNIISEACCVPTEICTQGLELSTISSIVGGGGHTLMLDRYGKVFACGWNNKGQLGLATDAALTFQPIEFFNDHKIIQVACGWDSSVAVASDGSLFVWGSNNYSQLGLPKQNISCLKSPRSVTCARVKQASLGLRHLALVTVDGKVFVSGSGSKGQLGIIDSNGRPFPEIQTLTQVPGLNNILSVSCGQHHSIVLSQTGRIFVWGDNKFGQLGLDSTVQPVVYVPQELPLSAIQDMKGNPISVMAGWTHSILKTDKGELVNWGRNLYGQLGSSEKERTVSWKPTIVNIGERVEEIAVGSEHNIALTESRQLLSWGWNEHGNCGTGTQENVLEPTAVQIEHRGSLTLIGSGACHSFVILDTGS